MSRATLFAAGATLLGGAACDSGSMNVSMIVHYGLPGIVTHPDAGADAADGGDAQRSDTSTGDDSKPAKDAKDANDGGADRK